MLFEVAEEVMMAAAAAALALAEEVEVGPPGTVYTTRRFSKKLGMSVVVGCIYWWRHGVVYLFWVREGDLFRDAA